MTRELVKVGIDIDDVKAKFMETLQGWHNRRYGTSLARENIRDYDFWKIGGCDKDEGLRRMREFFQSADFEAIEPIEGSQEGCRELARDFDLVSITYRPVSSGKQTLPWINNYFHGLFSAVYFANLFPPYGTIRKKVEICREAGVRVMVDDSADVAEECYRAGIGVVLLNTPWNESRGLPSGICRADDWKGVVPAVRRLVSL